MHAVCLAAQIVEIGKLYIEHKHDKKGRLNAMSEGKCAIDCTYKTFQLSNRKTNFSKMVRITQIW